jgi:hypothetical protein
MPRKAERAGQDRAGRAAERTVLIVSPYFPPSQLAGVHRARHLVRHLPAHGWTPIVLCVDEAYHVQRLDWELARLVPPQTEVIKVSALPASLTRRAGIGDIALRAWWPLRRRLLDLIATRQIDAVLITSAPYYPLLLAPTIRRRLGIPVVIDLQDPWVSRWGAVQHPLSKAGLSHRLAIWLEPRAVRAADYVTSVSQIQNLEMIERYPWLDPSRLAAIPIGGDPEDFEHLGSAAAGRDLGSGGHGPVELSYVGAYWPAVRESLRTFFRGAARLRALDPALAKRLRLNFIGTESTATGACYHVHPIAEAEGVGDMVREVPQRQPYLDALRAMARANGLLLIGSGEPHYTASKIYPALMSGRPYLSFYHAASSAHATLRAAGGGIALSFSDAADLPACEMQIAEGLRTLATSPEILGRPSTSAYAAYQASAIASRFAKILDQITEPGAQRRAAQRCA